MHVLVHHSSGYLIFKVKEFEEIGHLIRSIRRSYNDIKKFSGIIKLEMFYPFNDGEQANEELSSINEQNIIPTLMKKFLIKFGIRNIKNLGISYSNLANDFVKTFGITILYDTAVIEIIRSIKDHISSILKNHVQPSKQDLILKCSEQNSIKNNSSTNCGVNITNYYHLLKDAERNLCLKTAKLRHLIRPFYPKIMSVTTISDEDLPKFASVYFDTKIENKWIMCNQVLGNEKSNSLKKSLKNSFGHEIISLDSKLIKDCSDTLLKFIDDYNSLQKNTYKVTKKVAPNLTKFIDLMEPVNEDPTKVNLLATEVVANAGSLTNLANKSSTSIHTQNKIKHLFLRQAKDKSKKNTEEKIRSAKMKSFTDKCALAARVDYFKDKTDMETIDDSFGKECYEKHMLKLNTWANKKAIVLNSGDKDEILNRVKKFKLKRKEKKKKWRKRKNDEQKEVFYENSIEMDTED